MENIQNTVGAINSFNKLGGKDTDKMSVVMELMSNPVVAELVGKFLGNQPTSGADEKIHNDGRDGNGTGLFRFFGTGFQCP